MKTDFDIDSRYLFAPVVFRPDFNESEITSANQAWSLFFTAGRDDMALGANPELGRLFNNIVLVIALSVILSAFVFRYL